MAGPPFKPSKQGRRKGRQQTIEDVLGRASKQPAAASSFPVTRRSRIADSPRDSAGHRSDTDELAPDASDDDDQRVMRTSRMEVKSGTRNKASRGGATVKNSSPSAQTAGVRRGVVLESDDDDDDGDSEDEGDEEVTPIGSTTRSSAAKRTRVLAADDSSQGSHSADNGDDTGDSDEDVRPAKRRRQQPPAPRHPTGSDDDDDDDDLVVMTPPLKQTPSRLVRSSPAMRSSVRRSGPRTARQRHMELLRRRRIGEKVNEGDLESESEEYGNRRALYDKDPDHVALSDFEDEEEPEEQEQQSESEQNGNDEAIVVEDDSDELPSHKPRRGEKKRKRKEKKEKEKKEKAAKEEEQRQFARVLQIRSNYDDYADDDGYDDPLTAANAYDDNGSENPGEGPEEEDDDDGMADFIDDSHAGPLGAPSSATAEDEMAMLRREMPLQFTFQAHKPLKSHFKDAVEWLVHRRVNADGAFAEANDELYQVAWDRLDREVGGLAQSRFISSIWTAEFYSALRARPYMDSFNIRPVGGGSSLLLDNNVCHACGRTNHPASYRVMFGGKPYNNKTLDDVEAGEENDDEGGGGGGDHQSVDMNGNVLAPTSRQWYVGAVCHSNAETAHDLLHWRRALRDWVEEKLAADHVLETLEKKKRKKEKRNKRMRPDKLRAFVNQSVDDWEANGTISSLFRDFTKMLEGAQAKSTKTQSRYGW